MRRSSTWLIALVGLCGCAPKVTGVYVDLSTIPMDKPINAPVNPTPPKSLPAENVELAGTPVTRVQDRPAASGPKIRKSIADAQTQALKEIELRLRKFYDVELSRFELDQQQIISKQEAEALKAASVKLRTAFESYANERMPLFSQLTLLSGFPDPNPKSNPPDGALSPVAKNRFERTVLLREQLKQVDDRFTEDVRRILSANQDLSSARVAEMRLAVERFKEELDKRAATEAATQVRLSAVDLGLKLIEPLDLTLPATDRRVSHIPGEVVVEAAPEVSSQGILMDAATRDRLVRRQLDIWLSIHRYRLVDKGQGDDKTAEFSQWRNTFEVGH